MTKNADDRGPAKRPDANAARRARASHLKTHYNMTLEEEAELIRQQGGACAICGERPDELHVDHCHITGKVRGMLCLGCNCGIGFYKDDHNLTARATTYLRIAELLYEQFLAESQKASSEADDGQASQA